MIRNYVDHENIPVKLVGSGRDKDYSHDGFTHWAEDDMNIMKELKNIELYKPDTLTEDIFNEFISNKKPAYLNLSRF